MKRQAKIGLPFLWAGRGRSFVLIAFFIVICEVVGGVRDRLGRRLAWVGLLIGAVPIVWSLYLLAAYTRS